MVGFRLPFAGSGMQPDAPPLPVSAWCEHPSGRWRVTFDQRLRTRVLDHTNWTIEQIGAGVTVTSARTEGFYVHGTSVINGAPGAADDITYAPPPFDVMNRRGTKTVAFADFACPGV